MVRVLVVDDSGFFRRRIIEILNADSYIEVIGQASNGKEAVKLVTSLKPDLVTMDVEMPVMNGIEAVRRIMKVNPVPILMLSTHTTEGAQSTLDALEAGAVDFISKTFEKENSLPEVAYRMLCARVRILGKQRVTEKKPVIKTQQVDTKKQGHYQIVAIGSSTGGPAALPKVLAALPETFPLPILLMQHMPSTFTPAFAQRLNQLCAIEVREAVDGDSLKPGLALLAPGGKQMVVESVNGRGIVRIVDGLPTMQYRPCVDFTFASLAKVFPKKVLAILLTGMGSDGCEGARKLKAGASTLWAQDEASCVVYGMPMAVAKAGLVDQVVPLSEIGDRLVEAV
ncbi:MAG TPA: chemotaxis response regulator protein-glutamate methylesterase [Gammaproteobacteria bacterium]|nr:chemotaxis response regulator protein-glutamate methylesterase [Gammaproteobacteria bacterium]